ncbi:MAG: kelch repeat-containing protein [Myxococcota bacterium]
MRLQLLLLAAVVSQGACNGLVPVWAPPWEETTGFDVHFKWLAEKPPYSAGYYVFGRVEDRTDVSNPGILGTAATVEYTENTRLDFKDIPVGRNRVVIIEFRRSTSTSAPVLYYGLSQPFEIVSGQRTRVQVELDLVATPNQGNGAGATGGVTVRATGEAGYVNSPIVTLVLTTDRGKHARVSNLSTFPEGQTDVVELASLPAAAEGAPPGLQGFELSWDLDRNLAQACTDSDACARTVFVRFVDDRGYASDTSSASVTLDVRDPTGVIQVNSPIRESDTGVLCTITAAEPLHETEPPVITVTNGAGSVLGLFGAPASRTSTTVTYAVSFADEAAPDDDAYTITATLTDRAGRHSAAIVQELRVDRHSPSVSDVVITPDPSTAVREGQEIRVELVTSEDSAVVLVELPLTGGSVIPLPGTASGRRWTFSHVVTADDPVGSGQAVATATDAVGNRGGPWALGLVTVDHNAPALVDFTVAPSGGVVGIGTRLVLTAVYDEPIRTAELQAEPAGLFADPPIIAGNQVIWSDEVTPTTPSGPFSVTVSAEDFGGNRSALVRQDGGVIDPAPPEIDVGPEPVDLVAKAGDLVSVGFDVLEEPAALSVKLGALSMTVAPASSARRTFTYLVTGDEAEGLHAVTATIADAAGNANAYALGTVRLDFTAPVAEPLFVTPAAVGRGQNMTVKATFNEILDQGQVPGISATNGLGELLVFDAGLVAGNQVVWTRQIGAEDPQGTFDVVVTAVDLAGNEAAPAAATVLVDRDDPRVLPASQNVAPTVANATTEIRVAFDTSEPPLGPVLIFGASEIALTPVNAATHFEYTHAVSALDPPGITEVAVRLVDLAGNAVTAPLGTVTLDFDPPTLFGDGINVGPDPAPRGATLSVSVTLSEPIGGVPTITAENALGESLTFGTPLISGARAIWARSVLPNDPQGLFTITITAQDLAQNPSAALTASVTVDRDDPQVLGPGRILAPLVANEATDVMIAFDTSEPPTLPVVLRFGGTDVELMPVNAPTHFELVYDVGRPQDQEGLADVSVRLVDAAGNFVNVQLGAVTLDFTPPALASGQAVTVDPPVAAENALLTITALFDEVLAPDATLETAPDLGMGPPRVSGSSAQWTRIIRRGDPAVSGVYTVTVTAKDLAGNVTQLVGLPGGEIDTDPPVLAPSWTVEPADARLDTEVLARFTVQEPLTTLPEVWIGDVAMDHLSGPDADGGYVYSHVATLSDVEDLQPVLVRVVDSAGNASNVQIGNVRYDFTPPQVTLLSPAQTVGIAQAVLLLVESDEVLGAADGVVVRAPLGIAFDSAELSGNVVTWRHTVQEGVPQTTAQVDVTLAVEDLAGNRTTLDFDAVGWIDATRPQPGVVDVTPTRIAETGEVTVGLTTSEALEAEGPRVTIGQYPLACGGYRAEPASDGGVAYDYVCRLSMSDVAVQPGKEITNSVVAVLVDPAGNPGDPGTGTVVFDFKDPGVAAAVVSYRPGPDNPLGVVTAATWGTTIIINVIADEPLDPSYPPTLTLQRAGTVFTSAPGATTVSAGSAYFEVIIPASGSFPNGDYDVSISWRDVAGNTTDAAKFTDPPVTLRAQQPELLVAQDMVTYVRSPWGNGASQVIGGVTVGAGPFFGLAPQDPLDAAPTIPGAAFSLASGGLPARIRVWGDRALGTLLGMASPDLNTQTWPRLRLANVDAPVVYVTGLDSAGNESPPVAIRNSEWVATPKPPPFGTSPHVLGAIEAGGRFLDIPAGKVVAADEAGGSDGVAVVARTDAVWREIDAAAAIPSARSYAALGVDERTGELMMWGGVDPVAGILTETLLWDGRTWRDVTPAANNPPYQNPRLVFDRARGKLLLFTDALYAWEGDRWSVLPTQGNDNPWLHDPLGAAVTYDATRRRVVVYSGGASCSGASSAYTLEWDGTQWQRATPTASPTPNRRQAAITYDSARGQVVLVGGQCDNGSTVLQDTWTYDGNTWTQVSPANPPSNVGVNPTMAFDEARQVAVLYAHSATVPDNYVVYEWDGSDWTLRKNDEGPPSLSYGVTLAYHPVRERVMLHGGLTYSGVATDRHWEWDGTTWTDITGGSSKPAIRALHAMAFDSARNALMVFGGGGDYQTYDDDFWKWDGYRWSEIPPATPWPSARKSAMAYDPVGDRLLLFGGHDASSVFDDLWVWNGTAWSQAPYTTPWPPARTSHSVVFQADPAPGRLLVFGGGNSSTSLGDLWAWDGSVWAQLAGTDPEGSCAMAYDSNRQVTVHIVNGQG